MEAVRLRKENEILDAERQRQMAIINQQAREKKDNEVSSQITRERECVCVLCV